MEPKTARTSAHCSSAARLSAPPGQINGPAFIKRRALSRRFTERRVRGQRGRRRRRRRRQTGDASNGPDTAGWPKTPPAAWSRPGFLGVSQGLPGISEIPYSTNELVQPTTRRRQVAEL